ncbi:MAG: hypothetical protein AAGM38_12025 [Pseudomonadota bacterium]
MADEADFELLRDWLGVPLRGVWMEFYAHENVLDKTNGLLRLFFMPADRSRLPLRIAGVGAQEILQFTEEDPDIFRIGEDGETVLAPWPEDIDVMRRPIRSIELLWREDVRAGPSGALFRLEGGLRVAVEEWFDDLYAGNDFRFLRGERKMLQDLKAVDDE